MLCSKHIVINVKEETIINKSTETSALRIEGALNDNLRSDNVTGKSNEINASINVGEIEKSDKLDNMVEKLDTLGTMVEKSISLETKLPKKIFQPDPVCQLFTSPRPIVLLSLGRSGSGATWQILGNITGEETPSCEYTGSSKSKSKEFFETIGPNDGGNWVLERMCNEQKEYPTAAVVGFKWKPHSTSFVSKASLNGLKAIANSVNPVIKIVRSRRNLLDVLISRQKHNDTHLHGHCKVGDIKCMEEHKEKTYGMTLPIKNLVRNLELFTAAEDSVDDILMKMNVPHVHVTYENLYHSNDATEWKKILKFLQIEKSQYKHLTMEDVENSMAYVSTSSMRHEEILSNYVDVRNILKNTKFKSLLH